jgi:hypothetical protein
MDPQRLEMGILPRETQVVQERPEDSEVPERTADVWMFLPSTTHDTPHESSEDTTEAPVVAQEQQDGRDIELRILPILPRSTKKAHQDKKM